MSETQIEFGEKERDRFRKIVGVMERATIEGEREAAREAAERMASLYGMSLDEAILESHPERDDGQISEQERKDRRADFDAWMASRMRWTEAKERAEKARFEAAKRAAQARGLEPDPQEPFPGAIRRSYKPSYRPSNYKPSTQDRFRLIANLLKDGVSLRRVADLADASTNEVARIWLLIR